MGEQAKIVVERYPVDRLPEDLRARIGDGTHVRVVIETLTADVDDTPISSYFGRLGTIHPDPVNDISKLRDEWE